MAERPVILAVDHEPSELAALLEAFTRRLGNVTASSPTCRPAPPWRPSGA